VLATKRALAKAHYRKWGVGFTKRAGGPWRDQIIKFQKQHGLKADGVYGPATHKKMIKYFDRYGAYLYNHTKIASGGSYGSLREHIVANAIFGYNHRSFIHYTQGPSRMYGVKHHVHPPSIPYWEDCSSFVTWCYYAAGAPDPNHLGYNGYGFTGTLGSHGVRTSNPRPGDLCFYGYYPYHHVTIYIGNGRVISHGSEIGPLLTVPRYRSDFSHFRSYLA